MQHETQTMQLEIGAKRTVILPTPDKGQQSWRRREAAYLPIGLHSGSHTAFTPNLR